RLAVPEAVHQVRRIPGVQLQSSDGILAHGYADADGVNRLRAHRLVKGLEVLGQARPPEPIEPVTATIGHAVVEFLHQPWVQVGLVALFLKLMQGVKRP
ncbi:MAG: hypothetical protein HY713_00695, partial [candidate division NC10 bacterium]|nr:hypothetical protein [candidate division NC10 bacterium]